MVLTICSDESLRVFLKLECLRAGLSRTGTSSPSDELLPAASTIT